MTGPTAPAHGLTLVEVYYGTHDPFGGQAARGTGDDIEAES